MKTKNLKRIRMALRWGLGLMFVGFTVFFTVFALQLSPVQAPVVLWKTIMQMGFLSGVLGLFLMLLVGSTFVPGAVRLSRDHLQAHGHTYANIFSAIGVGLVGLFSASAELVKTHGPAVAEMMDTDTRVDESNSWCEIDADNYGPGLYEWDVRYKS